MARVHSGEMARSSYAASRDALSEEHYLTFHLKGTKLRPNKDGDLENSRYHNQAPKGGLQWHAFHL